MALDNSQKAKIRRYLGYPDASQLRYDRLEDVMSGLSAEGEVEVESILASLAALAAVASSTLMPALAAAKTAASQLDRMSNFCMQKSMTVPPAPHPKASRKPAKP